MHITQDDIFIYNEAVKNARPTGLADKFNKILDRYLKIKDDINVTPNEYCFHSISVDTNQFRYFAEYDLSDVIGHIDLHLLKNPDWENVLTEQVQEEKVRRRILEIKQNLIKYLEVKDKTVEIAKEFARLKGVRLSDIELGEFRLITNLDNIKSENIVVSYELRHCGDLDDHKILQFPMEILVAEDWKEKIERFHRSQTNPFGE